MKLGWFNFKKFNITEYQHYQQVENGDLNWIIPGKFVAFSSPYDKKQDKHGVIYIFYMFLEYNVHTERLSTDF